jgi:hypothetical protein
MKFRLLLLSCALVAAAFAADVTGKWTYEMQGRQGNATTATLNLKADGNTLTGTVSGRGGETEITDGKIDGDNVSFKVVREFNGNKMTMKYTGKVTEDGLKLKVEAEGSDRPAREFVAKRASTT